MAFAKEQRRKKSFLMDHHQLSATTIIHNTLSGLLINCVLIKLENQLDNLQGGPTYAIFTTAVFGLCTRKWGIFVLVGDPLQSH